jgi:hypothetical protein
MAVEATRRYTELLELNGTHGGRWAFPVFWGLFGCSIVAALAFCYLIEESQIPILRLASWFLVWLLWIPVSMVIFRVARRWPIDKQNWSRRLPIYFLAGLAAVAALLVLRVSLDRYLHVVDGTPFAGFRMRPFLVQSVVYDVFAFISFVALGHASGYYRQWTAHQIHDAYHLRLVVADDGPGLADPSRPRTSRKGIGLDNTRRRLEQLYGADHRFTVIDREGGGVAATLQIPFRPAGSPAALATREELIDHSHIDRRRRAASA